MATTETVKVKKSRGTKAEREAARLEEARRIIAANEAKTAPPTPLSESEVKELAKLEATVKEGITSYIQVGTALKAIMDKQLYRVQHKTFDAYCLKVWGFTRSTAYDYLKALAVIQSVQTSAPLKVDQSKLVVLHPLKDTAKRQQIVDMPRFEDMTVKEVLAEVNRLKPVSTKKTSDATLAKRKGDRLLRLVKTTKGTVSTAVAEIKSSPVPAAVAADFNALIAELESALQALRQLKKAS